MIIKRFQKILRFCFVFAVLSVNCQSFQAQPLDSLAEALRAEMAGRDTYDIKKLLKIEAIKELANDPKISAEQRFSYILRTADEFSKYSFDSTLLYIEKSFAIARQLDNKALLDQARLKMSATLGSAGRSKEAEDILLEIDPVNFGQQLHVEYCNIARKLYEDLSYYAMTDENSRKYRQLYNQYKDTLLDLTTKDSEIHLSILEKELLDERKLDQALQINSERLENASPGKPGYSLIAFQRSLIYGLQNNREAQKEYLYRSAISDIQASIKDNASLAALSVIIFNEGEIERAYRYISYAFEDAVQYNSRLRFFEISKTMALITDSYQQITNRQKNSLQTNLYIISALVIVLLITLIYIFLQVRKLSVARSQLRSTVAKLNDANIQLKDFNNKLEGLNLDLSEANHVKEQYIGNFLTIHSDYIEKIDKHQKLVKKMLNGRQFDKLMTLVSSQEYIELEIQEFYNTFDNAFMSLYPDFIDEINRLLKPDQQIQVREDEILNTELRIFALIRLGIKDSSHIARLLRYSVNTIYNYRVKIKNRAIVPRDDFEDLIKKIGSFSHQQPD